MIAAGFLKKKNLSQANGQINNRRFLGSQGLFFATEIPTLNTVRVVHI